MKQFFTFAFFLCFATIVIGQNFSDRAIASAYSPKKTTAFHFEAGECFPKVAADNVQLNLSTENTQNVKVYLLDANREVIKMEEISLKKGEKTLTYSIYQLASGKYSIYIQGQKSFLIRDFYVKK